jgi:hypothetical protein
MTEVGICLLGEFRIVRDINPKRLETTCALYDKQGFLIPGKDEVKLDFYLKKGKWHLKAIGFRKNELEQIEKDVNKAISNSILR